MVRSLTFVILVLAPAVAAGDETTLRGVVQGVDEAKGSFTIKRTTGKELIVKTDKYTDYTLDGKAAKLASLKTGQECTVAYEESNGTAVHVVSRTPKLAETGVQELIDAIGHPKGSHDKVKAAFATLSGLEKLNAIQIAKRIKAKGAASLDDDTKLFVAKHRSLFIPDPSSELNVPDYSPQ
jgi:hypothetical protein